MLDNRIGNFDWLGFCPDDAFVNVSIKIVDLGAIARDRYCRKKKDT
jgi:hypothetical protein